jgi:PAS domain S-box-containing protein
MNFLQKNAKAKILVVEDENIVALDIERGLKRLGYEVSAVVSNGKDAIQEVKTKHIDLILMDIQIQGSMDGIQTADEIRKLFNIPVIFLTAYADEATLHRAKIAEPYGYLLKPFEETELHTAIEVVLQKHRSFRNKEILSQEALILSEERFNLFVDSNKEYALYMIDAEGHIISWNAGAERIKGYKPEEIIGKHFSIFYTPEEASAEKSQHELEIAAQRGKFEEENWRTRKDGSKFWASIVITSLKDENSKIKGYGKVIRDLSATKIAEENLRQAIVARDEFMSIASHELRTPLTALKLQLQIAQRINPSEKSLSICLKQVETLSVLMDELLDISRIQSGKLNFTFKKTNLSKLVFNLCHIFEEAFKKENTELICEFQQDIDGIWDSFRIEQVITNLIANALKYAPGKPVKIYVQGNEDNAQLYVQDSGPGIPKEKQKKIFDRFERVGSPSVSGLGLGLYISHQIVEAHGGTIDLKSDLGKGSTFIVTLPRKLKEVNTP